MFFLCSNKQCFVNLTPFKNIFSKLFKPFKSYLGPHFSPDKVFVQFVNLVRLVSIQIKSPKSPSFVNSVHSSIVSGELCKQGF